MIFDVHQSIGVNLTGKRRIENQIINIVYRRDFERFQNIEQSITPVAVAAAKINDDGKFLQIFRVTGFWMHVPNPFGMDTLCFQIVYVVEHAVSLTRTFITSKNIKHAIELGHMTLFLS